MSTGSAHSKPRRVNLEATLSTVHACLEEMIMAMAITTRRLSLEDKLSIVHACSEEMLMAMATASLGG